MQNRFAIYSHNMDSKTTIFVSGFPNDISPREALSEHLGRLHESTKVERLTNTRARVTSGFGQRFMMFMTGGPLDIPRHEDWAYLGQQESRGGLIFAPKLAPDAFSILWPHLRHNEEDYPGWLQWGNAEVRVKGQRAVPILCEAKQYTPVVNYLMQSPEVLMGEIRSGIYG